MAHMFNEVPLSSLTLGDNFRFRNWNLYLKPPRSLFSASDLMREGKYVTDKWMKKDNQSAAYTAEEFADNYGKGDLTAGTYVAETPLLLWGNAPYAFDSDTGVLTIKSGTLGQVDSAPWKRDDDKKIDADKIKKISFADETKAPKNADYLFKNLSNLTEFENLTYLDTSETTSMVDTFLNCTSLTTLDLSKFNTKNVTDMRGTFRGCTSIKSLDLSNLNTLNVN
ncbi:BspA family leucine-rich repeat surface protein, partial [Lactococcus piscium]|nr:BspA family leucine-rich repeat surface protein [Lactococcus paracarnosus]MCJ1999061.1 BspA family leucine-rich repeat surface protein [Lactococcus paracarnosus]